MRQDGHEVAAGHGGNNPDVVGYQAPERRKDEREHMGYLVHRIRIRHEVRRGRKVEGSIEHINKRRGDQQ